MSNLEENNEIKKELIQNPDFIKTGLNNEQVLQNREKYGLNEIKEKKQDNIFVRFLKQLLDPMVILLIIATIISYVLAIIEVSSETPPAIEEKVTLFVEPTIILLIIIVNATFGIIQEGKADKEMQALQKLTSPNAKVIRNSELVIIPSNEIVKGDLIFLEAGDQIPADAILIDAFNLEVDESILTGESITIQKCLEEPDTSKRIIEHKNRIFSGTNVINGSAKAIVTEIGTNTQIGQISKLINEEENNLTPFQIQIQKLSKYIGIGALIVSIINFFIYILVASHGNFAGLFGDYWADSLKVSIALSIAAVPEGLLAVLMVVLASAVRRMSVKNALIKRLPAVETLGSVSVICSDKTGTLTQNKMTVVKMWNTSINELSNDKNINKQLLEYGTLCTNGSVKINEQNEIELVGDPTETSIINALLDIGISKKDLENQYQRILELPFDSNRKMMTVVVKTNDNKIIVITKGAPDQIFKICTNTNDIEIAKTFNDEMGKKALRVLGVSFKIIENIDTNETLDVSDFSKYESNQTLIGLLGIIDPPREEVKHSIELCKSAGIRPIMITGDHKNTAVAIAEELGIMKPGTIALTGEELSKISDEELVNQIEDISVFARVSPQDKIRIVKAWQSKDKLVSMTGDGVNDAPSLKAADIGCAMGITGTDVSKQAADVILTDDNFSTIVEAVKEGRQVMNSVKNTLVLLLTTTFSSLITIFFGIITFGVSIFSSLQILWSNVLSETIPGLVLGLNRTNQNLMVFKPRHKNANIVDKLNLIKIIIFTLIISIFSLVAFYIGFSLSMKTDASIAQHAFDIKWIWLNSAKTSFNSLVYINQIQAGSALAFLTLSICLSSNVLSLRSPKSIFKQTFKEQRKVILSFLLSFLTVAFVAYIPKVNNIFNMNPLDFGAYSWINIIPYLFLIVLLFIHEIIKLIVNHKNPPVFENTEIVIKENNNLLADVPSLKNTELNEVIIEQDQLINQENQQTNSNE